ncbi:conserved Plasmodium protein, unknown function [Babesia microti strain RI]|uniref:RNA-editing substrate-binding complex 6 protein domain-containing protein n=1 Tax=Babesia microti (strain RI) TaxID=1133968 RepID=A0A1N6LXQ7_BABMR|nr:conserved Plasmodium protein, unknown function [Babesia microti strain RI]SIO73660.1 conserved Plasmodium protein, unknown function [Babesia microti strain RI]|eukprot:XP_012649898.2 conserved Plasmodium protein, unknown function [Babesia microti strain RI]
MNKLFFFQRQICKFVTNVNKSEFLKSFNIDHTPITHNISITNVNNQKSEIDSIKNGKQQQFRLHTSDKSDDSNSSMYSKQSLWPELEQLELKYKNEVKRGMTKKICSKYIKKISSDTDIYKCLEQAEISIPITAHSSRPNGEGILPSGRHRPSSTTILESELGLTGNNLLVNDLKLPNNESIESSNGAFDELNKTIVSNDKEVGVNELIIGGKTLDMNIIKTIYGTTDPNEIIANSPASVIKANTGMDPETWINMDISKLVIQQKLQKSRSSSDILEIYKENFTEINYVNAVTALHRIAKNSKNHERYTLSNDPTMNKLLDHIYSFIPQMDQQSITNTLWALTRLEIRPNWISNLFLKLIPLANKLTPSELSMSLYCVAKFNSSSKKRLVTNQINKSTAYTIKDTLLTISRQRIEEFKMPIELTCIATSFARLNVRDSHVFRYIADKSLQLFEMNKLDVEHICSLIWSFARVNIVNTSLLGHFCKFIEKNADKCALRDLVNLCWSLSKLNYTPNELFIYTMSPMLRTFIRDMNSRDVSIIAWSYSNAGIQDNELFKDLSLKIAANVNDLSAQDIAALINCFSHMSMNDKSLFRSLFSRAYILATGKHFTPVQIKTILRGLANAELMAPNKLVDCLSSLAIDHKNSFEIDLITVITSLSKLGVDSMKYEPLLFETEGIVHKMYVEDCISLLNVFINEANQSNNFVGLTGKRLILANAYLSQCCSRARNKYNFTTILAANLLNSMYKLNLSSPELLHIIMKQIIPLINHSTIEEFCLLLGALSNTDYSDRAIIRTHIHRRPLLQNSLKEKFALLSNSNPIDASSLTHAAIRIGYYDDVIDTLFEKIELSNNALDIISSSQAIWAMTQAGYKPSWSKRALETTLVSLNSASDDNDSIWRLLWCAIVHNVSSDLILPIAESITNDLPKDIFQAQQIALALVKTGLADGKFVSDVCKQFYNDILAYMRNDLYENFGVNRYARKSTRDDRKFKIRDINYDLWISECLIQLHIPHTSLHVIENVYRISAAFPSHGFILDVISFEDTLAPKNIAQASSTLRKSQLTLLGHLITRINLSDLYSAVADKTARMLIAKTISSFSWQAREFLSFKNPNEFIPSYNQEQCSEFQD